MYCITYQLPWDTKTVAGLWQPEKSNQTSDIGNGSWQTFACLKTVIEE